MSCSSCKQEKQKPTPSKQELEKIAITMEKVVYGFLIVWSLFAVYGIYCFFKNFL